MYENRVLTYDEVLDLPEGAQVYCQERAGSFFNGCLHRRFCNKMTDDLGFYYDISSPTWAELDGRIEARFWLLPQPPTPEELAANPWPEEPDAHD